jgi:broad specificity phosphatase PhoE
MALYLVRHPQTENNARDVLTGWQKAKYSNKGEGQFDKIVDYFRDKNLDVFSSDLPRALKLGEQIASVVTGNFVVDKSLRERNFKKTKPLDSFESDIDFEKRIFDWLDKNEADDYIVVSHAGTIKKIVLKLVGAEHLKHTSAPRDVIFKIETVKNENKLSIIQT